MFKEKIKQKIRAKAGRCFELGIILLAGVLVCVGSAVAGDGKNYGPR